jgi:hypothetical protein
MPMNEMTWVKSRREIGNSWTVSWRSTSGTTGRSRQSSSPVGRWASTISGMSAIALRNAAGRSIDWREVRTPTHTVVGTPARRPSKIC